MTEAFVRAYNQNSRICSFSRFFKLKYNYYISWRTDEVISPVLDLPFILHINPLVLMKHHNIKIQLRLQRFSGRPAELSPIINLLLSVTSPDIIPLDTSSSFKWAYEAANQGIYSEPETIVVNQALRIQYCFSYLLLY